MDDMIQINVSGHQIKLTANDGEVELVEDAARRTSASMHKLSEKLGGGASQAKVATMVAFQYAFDLNIADKMLDEAKHIYEELESEKEAVKRLEGLLARADDALAS